MTLKTGFIGLGAMGFSMARNLHEAGLLNGVWNRNPVRSAHFCQQVGGPAHNQLTTLVQSCNTLVLCVSADQDVLHIIDDIRPHLRPDTLVIDCSTVSQATAVEAAERLKAVGAGFLDAPVSGGTEGAKNAALTIMVGGDTDLFERAQPVFQAMGKRVEHMGPTGAGQATKAVNQVMAAGINQAVGEALAFGEALQLPMDKLIDVVGSGAAGNWFVNHRGRSMVAGQYPPGFKMALHLKDLEICSAMAEAHQGQLPLVAETINDYRELIEDGYGDEDISALYRKLRKHFPSR